jgi:hypothetical protein
LELLSERRLELGPQRGDVDAHEKSERTVTRNGRLMASGHGAKCIWFGGCFMNCRDASGPDGRFADGEFALLVWLGRS